MGVAALALGASACAHRERANTATPQPTDWSGVYPTTLQPPHTFGPDFVLQQQVSIAYSGQQRSFEAVIQKTGDRLVVLGLAPHGGRGFALTQKGVEVHFQRFVPERLPFPPRFILYDVFRTWFYRAPPGTIERDGERVTTIVDDAGAIVERRCVRLDGERPGAIVVRYEGGLAPGAPDSAPPPAEVTFDNGWFGYRSTIRTLRWQPLAGAATNAPTNAPAPR